MTRCQSDLFGGEDRLLDDDPAEEGKSVTLTLVSHGEFRRSLKVSETGEEARARFLPLGVIKVKETGKVVGQIGDVKLQMVEVTMPTWLAEDRGLS